MGQRTGGVALGLWILGFAGTVTADELHQTPAAILRVLVVNEAGVRPEVVRAAEVDAAAIFAAAGVQLEWLDQESAHNVAFDMSVKMAAGMKPSLLPGAIHFSKHKGTPWSKLDSGFLAWCLRQPDMDTDVKFTARYWLNRRRSDDR